MHDCLTHSVLQCMATGGLFPVQVQEGEQFLARDAMVSGLVSPQGSGACTAVSGVVSRECHHMST